MRTEKRPTGSPGPANVISLTVSASRMQATVEIDAQHADKWSPDSLRRHIMSENIVYGIDEEAIKEIFDKGIFNQPVVIANGTPPQRGKDGSIRYHIDVHCLRGRPRILKSGKANHRELGLFQPVQEGQLLAERVAPTRGTPGRDVYGNEIPALDGKEAKLTGGKNTRISQDGNRLEAAIEGCLAGTPEKMEVLPTLNINGDVDYRTGNINSKVAVIVNGSVLPDFSVKSSEDVNVVGLVDGATIVSGGKIAINGGIQGGGRALLVADKGILTRFANDATLKSKGDIVIHGPVTHCRIETQGHLIAQGGKGVILGGEVRANHGVTADTIGSEMGVKTVVVVGPQLAEVNEKILQLGQRLDTLRPNYTKISRLMNVLAALKRKKGQLPQQKAELASKVKESYEALTAQINRIEKKIEQLTRERERLARVYRSVNVKGVTWPGTQIRILNRTFLPKTPMKSCTFTIIEGEIQVFAYKELTEPAVKKSVSGQEKHCGSAESK